ncbi:MAG TPA: hypothetical protein VN896_07375 [Methylomirabilota bacterium]|nr:hypothetical protein [Methylomirabilota bacterium]
MTRVAVIVAMVSALCIGMAFGFAGGVLFSHHAFESGQRRGERGMRIERRGPPGEPSSRIIVPHLTRMLDLTPKQAEAIRGEVEASRTDFAQVRDSLHARIERHLTAEQRDRWRAMVKERSPGAPRGRDPQRFRADPGMEGEFSR